MNFEDGATRFIDCRPGERVLDAAYRNKVNLPMDCSDGVCGTCKCRCEQGQYELGSEYIDDALSAQEAAEGLVLTCQMQVSSDCVIDVPVPAAACKLKPAEHECEIVNVALVSDSTILLAVRFIEPAGVAFLPGQYVNIVVPGTMQHRAYSFSSPPGTPEASFLIRNVPGGLMSRWLAEEARPGERLRCFGPNGTFFLREVVRPLLLLAGGTGLAPLLSMLEVLATTGTQQPIHLFYGVTADADLVELPRIERLAARLPTMSWSTCVADAASAHPLKGFITHHLTADHLNAGECDIYLCGPPAMVEGVRQHLAALGVTPRHFHYEKFSPSEAA